MTTTSSPGEDRASLQGAFVVLGVTGSIAAYKAVEICRQLMDGGAHVVPVLTKAACAFVGPLTFSALASEPTKTELFDDDDVIPHTRLGRSADLIVVAPATATIIGNYAGGIAPDLLSATLLATDAPVMLCPAMHTEMWHHQAVQDNLATLERRGVVVVPPEAGHLAGGDSGEGRLADPSAIVDRAARLLARRHELDGVKVLVTAGGTREPIDPVHVIANRSSGKQGHAIAEEARARGAEVTLVTTTALAVRGDIAVEHVESASELGDAVLSKSDEADVIIMAAAVADFRPVGPLLHKWKKRDGLPKIALEATTDVLAQLSKRRRAGQILVGFAAETTDALNEGRAKLLAKDLDLIVINDVTRPGVGFAHDTNAVTIIDRDGGQSELGLAPKSTIAAGVLDAVQQRRAMGSAKPTEQQPGIATSTVASG